MTKKALSTILLIESVLLGVLLLGVLFTWWTSGHLTELVREDSPNGEYTLIVDELGMPSWPFGADHIRVTLFENCTTRGAYYRASFSADVSNDGAPATYDIKWLEDGVQIVLIGEEQPAAYYILPFKTIEG